MKADKSHNAALYSCQSCQGNAHQGASTAFPTTDPITVGATTCSSRPI